MSDRRWLRARWSWVLRHPWVSARAFIVANIVLGIFISAGFALYQGGLAAGPKERLEWAAFCALGLAVLLFLTGWGAKAGRARMLKRNGVAYIVREHARDWGEDSPDDFYGQVRQSFADVAPVPGPGMTASSWDWPLDADARHWDARVTDLVRAFRVMLKAVHERNKEENRSGAADGIFVTAWWAVALAFGKRLRSGVRNWELDVWQRSTDGRQTTLTPDVWTQRPHRFADEALPVPDGLVPDTVSWDVDLTVSRLPGASAGAATAGGPVTVLLVRFIPQKWDTLELTDPPASKPVSLEFLDAGEILPVKTAGRVTVHELRCVPRPGDKFFKWGDVPFLAGLAVDWIQEKAADPVLGGHTLLLGAQVPPEVALGLGIRAGRQSCTGWPPELWPVIWKPRQGPLVTVRLNLGDLGDDGSEG